MAEESRPSITAQILARAPRPPLIFGCILLVISLFLGYIGGAVLDSGHFAHRASEALDDPAVQSEVAGAVSDSVSSSGIPAAAIEPVIGSVIAEPAFSAQFRQAVEKVHSDLVEGDQDTATLKLSNIGKLVAKQLPVMPPPGAVPGVALEVKPPSGVLSIVRTLHSLSWLTGLLGLAALAFLGWRVFRAFDRADAVRSVAKTMVVAGLLMVIVYFVARELITSAAGGTGAVGAIVEAYFFDFAIASVILAGAGVVGWVGTGFVSGGPRAKRPAKPAPSPAPAPPQEPASRGVPITREADAGDEAETEVIAAQRARVDLPTVSESPAAPPKRPARDRPAPEPSDPEPDERSTKTCPDCAETVLAAARVCKHCGYRFDPAP